MKYQCYNCQFCCIYSSPSVSYCGLSHECHAIQIKNKAAISISFVSIFLYALGLFALYALFRNRALPAPANKPIQIGTDAIEKPTETMANKATKQKKKKKKVTNTEIEGNLKKKKKAQMKYSKFTKSTNTYRTQTERRIK